MSEHGTTSRYTRGCRCKACRGANAAYQRAYQARRRAPDSPMQALLAEQYTIKPYTTANTTNTINMTAYPITFPGAENVTIVDSAQGFVSYERRSPLDELVDACIDLRDAFAAYHKAHTQEPAA